MNRILVLDTGTQGYVTVKSLKKAGHYVCLLCREKHNYADDSRYVDRKVQTDASNDNDYYNMVSDVITLYNIDAVIPMSDYSSLILSKFKKELSSVVKFVLPDLIEFEKGYNKNLLMTICSKNNYPHPNTINNIEDVTSLEKKSLLFPLLIKPNHTCGGRGMTLVNNFEELEYRYREVRANYGPCHLQEYIPRGGAQVEVQLYVNEKKELKASSVIYKYRWYPENGGSSCCATVVKNEKAVEICYKILKDIGWIGFADFDMIADPRDGKLKVMELNPRLPACVKAAVVSGIDWPNIIINEYLNLPYKIEEYKNGLLLKHIGMEFLWFFYSKDRFRTKPALWKFFGKNIFYQDFDIWDPLPFIFGTLHNIKKQFSPSFRKSKSGTR